VRPRQLTLAAALLFVAWTGLVFAWPAGELRDYGSFVASGRAAAAGDDPYGIHPLTFHVVLPGFDVWNPNLNPPVSLPVFALFDRVDPHAGFRAWWFISFGCYLLAVVLLLRHYASKDWLLAGWAIALAGFWDTLALGQIYLPLVLAAVGAWLLLDRNRPVAGGILIGVVVAVKPNFAVWPALLLLSGEIAVAGAAAGTVAVLWVIPLVIYGPGVYRQWVELLLSDTGRGAFLTNASLPGLAQRMDLALAGTTISIALLLMAAAWTARQKPGRLEVSALGIIGGILASPIAWVHYTLFLLPVFFSRRWNPPITVAAILLAVPVPWVLRALGAPDWQQLTLGSVYSWAVLLCAAGMIMGILELAYQRRDSARLRRVWTSSSTTSTTPS
jgi:hypothetical protein